MTNSLTEKLKKKLAFNQDSWHEEHSCYELFTRGALFRNEQLSPVLEALIECVEILEDAIGIGISTAQAERALAKLSEAVGEE